MVWLYWCVRGTGARVPVDMLHPVCCAANIRQQNDQTHISQDGVHAVGRLQEAGYYGQLCETARAVAMAKLARRHELVEQERAKLQALHQRVVQASILRKFRHNALTRVHLIGPGRHQLQLSGTTCAESYISATVFVSTGGICEHISTRERGVGG